jgi:beta-N-acetylhexosaminidase
MGARDRRSARTATRVCAFALLVAALALAGCGAQPGQDRSSSADSTAVPTRNPVAQPTAAQTTDPIADYAADRLSTMTLPEKVASLLMLHRPGTDAGALRSFVDHYGLGGLILMGDNVPASVGELRTMTDRVSADPGLPVLIGIDQEGGTVSRLVEDRAPGATELRSMPVPATTDAFRSRSTLLKNAGITVNFGIVADVTADPHSFIYDRVLGTGASSAAQRVAAAVAGERGRVVSTLKHFPGHGAAAGDSHRGIPMTGLDHDAWLADEAPPFQAGIEAGAGMVMFGHLAYSAVDARPASLSPVWHRILRKELGFRGVAITDDMLMLQHSGLPQYASASENAIAALKAGNTMLLYVLPAQPGAAGIDVGALIASIADAVDSGRIPESVIDDDVRRLLEVRRAVSGETGPFTVSK